MMRFGYAQLARQGSAADADDSFLACSEAGSEGRLKVLATWLGVGHLLERKAWCGFRLPLLIGTVIPLGFATSWIDAFLKLECMEPPKWTDEALHGHTCIYNFFGGLVLLIMAFIVGSALVYYSDEDVTLEADLEKEINHVSEKVRGVCGGLEGQVERNQHRLDQALAYQAAMLVKNIKAILTRAKSTLPTDAYEQLVATLVEQIDELRKPALDVLPSSLKDRLQLNTREFLTNDGTTSFGIRRCIMCCWNAGARRPFSLRFRPSSLEDPRWLLEPLYLAFDYKKMIDSTSKGQSAENSQRDSCVTRFQLQIFLGLVLSSIFTYCELKNLFGVVESWINPDECGGEKIIGCGRELFLSSFRTIAMLGYVLSLVVLLWNVSKLDSVYQKRKDLKHLQQIDQELEQFVSAPTGPTSKSLCEDVLAMFLELARKIDTFSIANPGDIGSEKYAKLINELTVPLRAPLKEEPAELAQCTIA